MNRLQAWLRAYIAWSVSAVAICAASLATEACAAPPADQTAVAPAAEKSKPFSVTRKQFGKLEDGTPIDRFTIRAPGGLEADVMTLGATLITVRAPDRAGQSEPVTLYLDSLDDYLRGHPLFGSVVGRFANRIAGAKFTIDGVEYPLAKSGSHHIHGGGKLGLQNQVWQAESFEQPDAAGVRFTHTSPDGHAGYPGKLDITVTYTLTADRELKIEYVAHTDRPTHVNLTNHAYFNLAGAGSGDVLGHRLFVDADAYLPHDGTGMPTGEILSVEGTPMDFRTLNLIGARVDAVQKQNYDHCYVLNKPAGKRLALAARVSEPKSGRTMEVWTTQPGVQIYTAKGLSSKLGAGGKQYGPYHGVCFETQHYPNSPNEPKFPSTLLRPGETFSEETVFRFGIAKGE
ncbi:MAG: aldose epimerase family protein [Planctomycetota bacterium]